MWVVRVKDRGRDLVVHKVDTADEAGQLRSVYERLGYPPDKILIEAGEKPADRAA